MEVGTNSSADPFKNEPNRKEEQQIPQSIEFGEGLWDGAESALETAQKPRFLSDFSRLENRSESPLEDKERKRAKSALRLRYEAEIQILKRKIGDLESIRGQLGLSQRAICQLLLVDPSAWTRWTRRGEEAPPHIYRALQWYMAANDKYPALDVNFWLSTVRHVQEPQTQYAAIEANRHEIESLRSEMQEIRTIWRDREIKRQEIAHREAQFRKRRQLLLFVAFLGGICLGIGVTWLGLR